MRFYSINKQSPPVNFRQATINGQPPGKSLYFPEKIPSLEKDLIKNISVLSNEEIAFRVIRPYIDGEIDDAALYEIVKATVNFAIPLLPVNENVYALELYHGSTLSFKDVGARFMSRCLAHFIKSYSSKLTVLVATSGDTGSAVAHGFYGVEGINVVVLYPAGKVSMVQEMQLTTLGSNIHAFEVNGSFDDCQAMVKQAFADKELNEKCLLTSANSINVARWLPQQFFYYFGYKQWPVKEDPPVFCVPSGNFGNICAGMLAKKAGLPIKHFIAACNANNVVPRYLINGRYDPAQTIATISNAMDVGDPSNFIRITELYGDFDQLKKELSAYTISDEETRKAVQDVFKDQQYLLDPHGAVAFIALQKYLVTNKGSHGIFLETAHPVKFYDIVEPLTGQKINVPGTVKDVLEKSKQAVTIEADYGSLRSAMLSLI